MALLAEFGFGPVVKAWAVLLFFVVPTVAVAIAVYRPIRRHWAADPSCGACKFKVRNVNSFVCPECGADLREVGIRRPGGGVVAALALALLLGALVGGVYMGSLWAYGRVERSAAGTPASHTKQP